MKSSLTREIIGAAFKVHSNLGPGLMEHVYRSCLQYELEKKGLGVRCEVPMPVTYDRNILETGYRLDLLVESAVIVELKAVSQLLPLHKAQLLTYLKLSGKPIGLIINFNSTLLKDGIVRLVN